MYINPQNAKPYQIYGIIFMTFVLPFVISLIFVNFNLVFTLILPFHFACTSYFITLARGPIEVNAFRNFILCVLMIPIIYAPFGLYGKIFGV
jgi:hypothetical protein